MIKAYKEGKLGSQTQVERALGGGNVASGKPYFTSDGRLRPYSTLKAPDQIGEFNDWMATDPRVLAATLDDQNAAVQKAIPRSERECR